MTLNKSYNAEYGKVPPQALDLEKSVLGSLMIERDAFISVGDILKPDCFYDTVHQKIYSAIQDLFRTDAPIDQLTVAEKLKQKGQLEEVGGHYYLSTLTAKMGSAVHIEYHAKIIAQKYIQRRLISVCTEIQEMAFDETVDISDLIDTSQKTVFEIFDQDMSKDTQEIKDIIVDAVKSIENTDGMEGGINGIPSGFDALDKITHGWQPSDLVIIAARPAMGKTSLVLNMARNMAVIHKEPVAVFSLEMSNLQLVNRLIASETEFGAERLRKGNLSSDEWTHFHSKIKNLIEAPIFVDDTPSVSVVDLRRKCRRLKQKYGIKMLIIDYLQLMTAGVDVRNNRVQEVSIISRTLKVIAKELNIPVIALSQLNRGVETRTGDNKKPMLSDLRESGSIEQDADIVLFIHRPEYYGVTSDSSGTDLRGKANIIVAKHRNGSTGEVLLKFDSSLTRFENLYDTKTLPSKINTSEKTDFSDGMNISNPDFGEIPY